jgi:hypothetical protein
VLLSSLRGINPFLIQPIPADNVVVLVRLKAEKRDFGIGARGSLEMYGRAFNDGGLTPATTVTLGCLIVRVRGTYGASG